MDITGGCYCGALRFEIVGGIPMRGLCLCQTCQKISGGAGNLFVGVEASAFRYTLGSRIASREKSLAKHQLVSFVASVGSTSRLALPKPLAVS